MENKPNIETSTEHKRLIASLDGATVNELINMINDKIEKSKNIMVTQDEIKDIWTTKGKILGLTELKMYLDREMNKKEQYLKEI